MRPCLIFVLLVTAAQAAPMAGLAPAREAFIEASANTHFSGMSSGVMGIGRLGFANDFDAGLALGLGVGDVSGITVGIPSRWQWFAQSETNGIARLSSDFWISVTQASPEIHTVLSATASASHARRMMGLPLEIRLTAGGLLWVQDRPDLEDNTEFHPVVLVGLGGWVYEGWQCSFEGGLGAGSGQFNIEASLHF